MAATASYSAVPSMLIVAPIGSTNRVTRLSMPRFSSKQRNVIGNVPALDTKIQYCYWKINLIWFDLIWSSAVADKHSIVASLISTVLLTVLLGNQQTLVSYTWKFQFNYNYFCNQWITITITFRRKQSNCNYNYSWAEGGVMRYRHFYYLLKPTCR